MLCDLFHINGYALLGSADLDIISRLITQGCYIYLISNQRPKILSSYKKLNCNIPRTQTQNKDSVNETITHDA
ncbi:hypothetical protein PCHDS_000550800 [Plasmodium chabaudi adami]|uniref:Uncharacterized protein n=1 Tax=Plasmodium chabaudi adami TaxID=5826 RepID=A0A1C6WTN1_PLACE|nr:hypothetical protein PCHDS_000550800 [Plasmodium chabaudi adami]SCM09862.1 hypothetical protein PCHDK_000144600 [Plasmodium chabaudi adami]